MAKVEITKSLYEAVNKKFKQRSVDIFEHLRTLEKNHKKGKELGTVGRIVIKELKYSGFRFYFITDGFKLKCLGEEELVYLLIRFVRMSDKKHQQKMINEIKHILRVIAPEGFD